MNSWSTDILKIKTGSLSKRYPLAQPEVIGLIQKLLKFCGFSYSGQTRWSQAERTIINPSRVPRISLRKIISQVMQKVSLSVNVHMQIGLRQPMQAPFHPILTNVLPLLVAFYLSKARALTDQRKAMYIKKSLCLKILSPLCHEDSFLHELPKWEEGNSFLLFWCKSQWAPWIS